MNTLNKKSKIILAAIAVLLICSAGVLWAQHEDRNKKIPVRVRAWDQLSDWSKDGPKVVLLSFFVDRSVGGTTGEYCCVMLPKYWRPGLSFELYWDYTEESEGSPPPQKIQVEVEEYKPENIGALNIHFFPGHRVKAIVSQHGFGTPFYPLPKEEWVNWKIDKDALRNWKEHYCEMIKLRYIPTDEDWKWAAQWGLYKEEATKCLKESSEQEKQQ